MTKKHKSRELAMQILFLWDTQGNQGMEDALQMLDDAALNGPARSLALRMASEAWNAKPTSDPWMERVAPQWPPHRQPAVDRNVLRLAIWELTQADTPPKVVIDEAIELVKKFSTRQSAAFVNGVLDAVLKEHQQLTTGHQPLATDH